MGPQRLSFAKSIFTKDFGNIPQELLLFATPMVFIYHFVFFTNLAIRIYTLGGCVICVEQLFIYLWVSYYGMQIYKGLIVGCRSYFVEFKYFLVVYIDIM